MMVALERGKHFVARHCSGDGMNGVGEGHSSHIIVDIGPVCPRPGNGGRSHLVKS